MENSNTLKEKVFNQALDLSGVKWWKPAIFKRIKLKILVDEYFEFKEKELREKIYEARKRTKEVSEKIDQ